ncbi:carboxypeptidase-like regulatory domain-containing protein [Niabella hibiscisoli]|uniref:carboxypeptidase-like regulatory domain-containing protein n=1 Tax=Niabella hibiscisoli TaxID=1825928 RepID=UPI001F0FCF7A|nr:carboxypeptidase-like regulatory domain-containing protein [Niabella hibiscisoli]MCH5716120.1 TonB-dependent receptor plug domain-containing protein [Niabella hibiscisoli]
MTGRAIDASTKLPIANASVIIDGFAAGAFTNEKGLFKINVPQKGKIVISMVGYSELTLKTINGNVGDVELTAEQGQLEEVVVVGFGTKQKKMLTGSVASVSSNELSDTTIADIADLMQGKVAGVMIRGSGTMAASQKPLLIVDGVPFEGDINSLNQNDIETLNVIKSADATAIYGARAANGVVIIKTKKEAPS